MKRLLTLMAVVFGLVFIAAARPLVTLSHNGELSFFNNLSALQSALDSAQNGDIIYLSDGQFTSNSGDITIKKRVSIVGCGYKSHIVANLTVNMTDNPDSYMDAPLFDGVRMEKLTFFSYSVNRVNLQEVEIRKCRISELENGGYAGKDFRLDRCLIESADFDGANSNNTYVNNCKIRRLGVSTSNPEGYIQISNCTIGSAHTCPRVVMNSIIAGTHYSGSDVMDYIASSTHTIYNSLFPSEQLVNNSSFRVDNCYFEDPEGGLLDDDLNCNINLTLKGYLGDDGTIVGAYGGEFPFSETPSVPTVDSANSSVEYDADANKLKVTITVMEN